MHVSINAPAAAVWPYVADPVLMSAWNEKIIEVERDQVGPVALGERYTIIYAMGTRQTIGHCEVVHCAPPNELVVRMRPDDRPTQVFVERYELIESRHGTQLVQTIDLRHSGIPRWARAIMWLIQKIGRSRGTPYLHVLKQLVEGSGESSRAA